MIKTAAADKLHELWEAVPDVMLGMTQEIRSITSVIYRTPKWHVIKRYRLYEKREKLQEDHALMVHVLYDDDDPNV